MTPCGRTRREFLWQAGAGFTGLALGQLVLGGWHGSTSVVDRLGGFAATLPCGEPRRQPPHAG